MLKFSLLLPVLLLLSCGGSKSTPARSTSTQKPKTQTPAKGTTDRPDIGYKTDGGHIAWVDSERLMPVLEEARRLKKPVFIEFHASWCAPCKVMEEEVFTQPDVYNYLNSNFLNFRSDFDAPAGHTIAEIFEVKQLPTILFVNGNGVAVERYTGIISAEKLQAMGNRAKAAMGQ